MKNFKSIIATVLWFEVVFLVVYLLVVYDVHVIVIFQVALLITVITIKFLGQDISEKNDKNQEKGEKQ